MGKLPTNDKLINLGFEPAKCFCCTDHAGMENIQHIFNLGQFAAKVWKEFVATTGI